MPTIEASKKDLEKLIGKKFSMKELEEALMFVKGELDRAEGDALSIDVKETNRPELWSAEGIAREIKTRMGKEKGLAKYRFPKSGLKVTIEKSVKEARPYTVGAVVKGLKITDELIRQMVQLQEKVDGTHGRKRRESSTGIYDFDKIKGNIRFYGADPRKKKFIPLEYKAEMDLDEILEVHPKGKEYAHLLKGKKLYPVFEDSKGNVLSMPPVINSNYSGKVTEKTRNLFIEVSGFDRETILIGLKVMVMALRDRGGKIETVEVIDADGKKYITPEFGPKKMMLETKFVEKITGIAFKEKEIVSILEKAGMDAKSAKGKIEVLYPDYRKDIIHPVDLVEDIIIGYGYNNIMPQKPEMAVTGRERKDSLYLDKARDVCAGMGLQEVLTFTLTSKEKQEERLSLAKEALVEIANPVSLNWSVMRKRILPELLEFLAKNRHAEYPQRIFEIGSALEENNSTDTGTIEKKKLCILISENNANFTMIKSALGAICKNLGLEYSLSESSQPFLDEGRRGEIKIGAKKGFIGEVNKKTLAKFGLDKPCVCLEMEL